MKEERCPAHKLSTRNKKHFNLLRPDVPVVILLFLTEVNLLLFFGLLRLKNMKSVIVKFVHILFIGNNGHDFARLSGGDCAKGHDIVPFRTPGNIMNVCKLK